MSSLHNKLTNDAENLKHIMISGYVRSITDDIDFPGDLIILFYNYYNDVLYWHINPSKFKDAKAVLMSDIAQESCNPSDVSPLFIVKNIPIQYRLYVNYQHEADLVCTLIYFKAKLPENVNQISFYVEMYCPEVGAPIRRCFTCQHGNGDPVWCQFIFMNLSEYEHALIATRFEILSIKYYSDITPYYKTIFMKR